EPPAVSPTDPNSPHPGATGPSTPSPPPGATGPSAASPATPSSSAENFTPIRARSAPKPGTWVAAVIVALLVLALINFLITNPVFEWDTVATYILDVKVVQGVGWTLLLTVLSMALGTAVALTAAIMRRSDNAVLRGVSWAYIFVFRGIPVYTQLVFWGLLTVIVPKVAVGVPFGPELLSISTRDLLTAFWAAVIRLGLTDGAYVAEPELVRHDAGTASVAWRGVAVHRGRLGELPITVVHGHEPGLKWREFLALVLAQLGPEDSVVLLGGLHGEVPHTRPLPVVAY